MYMFVLMSSGWYAKKFDFLSSALPDAREHLMNGNVVAFNDDIDYFAHQMNISTKNITIVEEE